ncbi:sensor histidine kinase [Halarcobacter anaerophilus]|jgi:hypothetical protein|uniref:histidine kinase n=2 Tax=Halarcobacter anaerophilus TaxID=877500 RepID=A0A4Q0Y1H5_9BACT|nr:HAMP domain-containing sensor histidine kinase [Halarcobacter anaerophilus]QDF28133.1 two-component system sensor histidine kinase [Halarcobacter anaerophilus]RXJ62479.1 hypothetical protein CRV06_10080 [Halarcobacter anaerophilus]
MPKYKTKLSTIIILFLTLFIGISFVLRYYLIENTKLKYLKNEQIFFYKLQNESNSLLTYILYQYSSERENLKKLHQKVVKYLVSNGYDNSLDEIYNEINKNHPNKPYDIYITDKNLTIINTTYKPDLGFNLSFAKESFLEHKKRGEIGVSAPIFESYSQKFFSYTDSFLPDSNRVVQVSFKYKNADNKLEKIYSLVNKNSTVSSYRAYTISKDGYIGDFIFKKFKGRKLSLDEMKKIKNDVKNIVKKMDKNFIKIDKSYKTLYAKQQSIIFDDIKIIYSLTFDKSFLQNEIDKIDIIYIILLLIGLLTIYILFKIRDKEILLNQKDMFIKHSVHEIKTPLSIILLNNQLRDKIKGKDSYSLKIEGAIKTLKNSYDDMTFLMTRNKLDYSIKKIELSKCLKERVEYFSTIATAQGREIKLQINSKCIVKMDKKELIRLIDNNLSNAIKYSKLHSLIEVTLENNILNFTSQGDKIVDKKAIFDKYKRENSSIGGHGLGLSIVKDITQKYNIKKDVISKKGVNSFIYYLNCHNPATKKD